MKVSPLSCMLLLLTASSAGAVTISPADLPGEYRQCASSSCQVGLTSAVNISGMSAFRANDGTWLLRYSLHDPRSTAPGYVWLRAAREYDLSQNAHAFTMYFDHVDPALWPNWPPPTERRYDFTVTTNALLAGSARHESTCCSGGEAILDLSMEYLQATPDEGASARAELNLINFFYTGARGSARLSFNRADSRSVLYSQLFATPTPEGWWTSGARYQVAPVPLPAGIWLLLSAMPALGFIGRHRRAAA